VKSLPAILFGVVAAFANLMGAWAVTRSARLGLKVIELLFAYAAGFMLALAIAGVIPEAIARDPVAAAPVILVGYLLVHLTQHTVTPHFHFGEETHHVSHAASLSGIIGLLLHTFFDGVAIASGFLVSPQLGLLFFLAIFLHKLPEGVTVSSLVLAAGETSRRAVLAAAALGAATILGVLLTERAEFLVRHGLALSAGVTLYVGASNLVPEFQGKPGWRLPAAFFAGAGSFVGAEALISRVVG
jgi:zinc and cadmium transporter